MTDHAALANTISTYAKSTRDALDTFEAVVLFFRSLRNPELKAQRLRRAAGRLWRAAAKPINRHRADNLKRRATDKWNEAQRLHPIDLQVAIVTDGGSV